MNDELDFTIPTELDIPQTPTKRVFPVFAQLSLLGLVLLGIFALGILPLLKNSSPISKMTNAPSSPLVMAEGNIKNIPELKNISISAKSAFVYDVRTKKPLYNKSADAVLPLASITKLMTTLVAHELVGGDKTTNIQKNALLQSGASGLNEGEKISMGSLSDYAILASSNDAAFALAAAVGAVIDKKEPNKSFVKAMNIRAIELGLPDLKFINPTGLDETDTKPGAVGTSRQVSYLMEYILTNYPGILEPSTVSSAKIYNAGGGYHDAENTNPIISKIPNLLGSKTGYTDLAGGNLTVAFDAGFNRPIIVTVLGSTYDGRFADVEKIVKAIKAELATE